MIGAFVLFLVLTIWGMIDGEIYAQEGIILFVLWALLLAGFLLLPGIGMYAVVGIALIDIYLIIKLVGNPKAF